MNQILKIMRENFEKEEIYSLHRYYIQANRMKIHFYKVLSQQPESSEQFIIESKTYMQIWYSFIYVVIEGWQQLKLSDDKINTLLNNEPKKVALLKKYRNATFHYQKIYNNNKFENFYKESTTVNWIFSLNEEFGRWFLANLSKKDSPTTSHNSV